MRKLSLIQQKCGWDPTLLYAELTFDSTASAAERGERHEGAVVVAGTDEAVADDGFEAFLRVGVAVDRVGAVMFASASMVCSQRLLDCGDLS